MKRLIKVVFAFLFIWGVYSFTKPFVSSVAKKQVALLCPGAQVFIGGCSLDLFHRLAFSDIRIINAAFFELRIKRFVVEYDVFSLLKATVDRVSLDQAQLFIHTPAREIANLKKCIRLNPGKGFFVREAVISHAGIDVRTKDLVCSASLSSEVNISRKSFSTLRFELESFESNGLRVEGLLCRLTREDVLGEITARKIDYQKLAIAGLTGDFRLDNNALSLTSLSASCLGGTIAGDMKFSFEKTLSYRLHLNAALLDLAVFVRDFELSEKLQIRGLVGGGLGFSGSDTGFQSVQGDFSVVTPGGALTIKDTRFLEHVAQNSKQSMGFVSDAFKDYLFNTGGMHISLEGNDLILQVSLKGPKGNRDFTVSLRDFSLKNLLKK
ncbi:MAG: YdbH domain-containing protein [Candidatus Omnitrophota bacterium]|jgi:hypothetical protein